MMGGPRRILILSASAGAGHVRAAEALEMELRLKYPSVHVRHVDTLEFTTKILGKVYSNGYIQMISRAPKFLGWLYDSLDTPWRNERMRLAVDASNAKPLLRLLKEFHPDLCICTHFLPAEIISWLKNKNRLSAKLAVVVTDFYVHAMWLCRNSDYWFLPSEEQKKYLQALGIKSDTIVVSGIPIDSAFGARGSAEEIRKKHGLREDSPTVLISGGGYGVGAVEAIVGRLLEVTANLQIIAVCGKNEALYRRLSVLPTPPHKALRVVGFTKCIDELMSVADLLVGKPGGLTTSEALAKSLAFVIVDPIPGQEERNADYLLENGVALKCQSLEVLPYKVELLLNDRARLLSMRRHAGQLGRPLAATTVIEALMAPDTASDRNLSAV